MISDPGDYSRLLDQTDYSLADIFNQTGVRLAVWDPAADSYAVTPDAPANILAPEQGYWVRFATPTNLIGAGSPTDTTATPSVLLTPGWNMIGCPSYSLEVNTIDVENAAKGGSESFSNAVTDNLVGGTLYTFQAGDTAYEEVSAASGSLSPYEGYWVYALQPCTLIYPPMVNPGKPVTISAATGGTITNGRNSLTIFAGSLASDTVISLTTGVNVPTLDTTVLVPIAGGITNAAPTSGAVVIGTGVDIEPTGLQLSKAATLAIDFDPSTVKPGWLVATATVVAGNNAVAQPQSEFTDAILASGIEHFSIWAPVALNPWWGKYTGTLSANGDIPIDMTIDYGGNVVATWTAAGQAVTLTGIVTDAVSGAFAASGTAGGSNVNLAGTLAVTNVGPDVANIASGMLKETSTGGILANASFTDLTTPLNSIIYASTAH